MHTPYGATEALPVASISAGEVLGETLDDDELPENLPPNTTPQRSDI